MTSETPQAQLNQHAREQQTLNIQSPEPRQSVKASRASPRPSSTPGKQRGNRNRPHVENYGRSGNSPLPELDGTQTSRTRGASGAHRTSSSGAGTDTPPKQAYAGPVFHASPEPTSLPIPKFFNKTGLSTLNHTHNQYYSEGISDRSASSTPAEQVESNTIPITHRTESPLDFLFMAQKQERERERSVDNTTLPFDGPNPLASGSASYPAQTFHTPLRQQQEQAPSKYLGSQVVSGKEALMLENDLPVTRHRVIDTSDMISFQDRLEALGTNSSPFENSSQDQINEELRQAKTAELKKMLFSHVQQPQTIPIGNENHPLEKGRQTPLNMRPEMPSTYAAGISPRSTPTGSPFSPDSTVSQFHSKEYDRSVCSDDSSPKRKGRHQQRGMGLHQRTAVMNASRVAELPTSHSLKTGHRGSLPELMSSFDNHPFAASGQTQGPPHEECGIPAASTAHVVTPVTKASVKEMEDDLRRILKMDT